MVRTAAAVSVALWVALPHSGMGAEAASGTTIIAGTTYRFPDAAFADGQVEHGRQAGVLLALTWPGMAGIPFQFGSQPEPDDQIQTLANSDAEAGERAPDAKLTRAIMQSALIMADMDPRHPSGPLEPFPGGPSGPAPGLVPVVMGHDTALGGDFYVKPPLDQVVEFVHCDRKGGIVEFPHCSQEFVLDGMLMKVSYPAEHLSEWRKIHDSVETFFRSSRARP